MDHGGETVSPTTVEFTDLGMAGAVQGGEGNISTGTLHSQLSTAAARRRASIDGFEPSAAGYHNFVVLARRHVRSVLVAVFHRVPGPGVAYANIGAFWRQYPGPVGVVLVGPQLPDGVVPVHDNYYGYFALQLRPVVGRGVVLATLLPGVVGAVYNGDYTLQPHPDAGHGEVLVDLLHVPDGAGHGEVVVRLLPGGIAVVYDDYGYYLWHPRPGFGRVAEFPGWLANGVGSVFHHNSGDFDCSTSQRCAGILDLESMLVLLRLFSVSASGLLEFIVSKSTSQ